MKTLSLTVLALAAALAIVPAASASPIYFTGGVSVTDAQGVDSTGDVWTSSAGPLVLSTPVSENQAKGTGIGKNLRSLLGVSLANIEVAQPTSLNITNGTSANNGLILEFSVAAGGDVEFVLQGPITVTQDNAQYLTFSGTGTFEEAGGLNGYINTPGTFTYSVNDNLHTFGVGEGDSGTWTLNANLVPEPSTLLMFGTGLLGLAGLLRRKFMHSR
jgi:hypothetical protein